MSDHEKRGKKRSKVAIPRAPKTAAEALQQMAEVLMRMGAVLYAIADDMPRLPISREKKK